MSVERRRSLAATALLSLLAFGCATDHLVFTTYTKVGIDVSSVDGQPAQAVMGYKRFEGAILPVDVANENQEAPSVFAGSIVRNGWFSLDITQVFATGKAAEQAAADTEFGMAAVLATATARLEKEKKN